MTTNQATIQREEHKANYTVINNCVLQDKRLSWKARGLLVYLLSLPDDWRIYVSELANRAPDGEASTRAAFNELVELDYISKVVERDDKARITGIRYTVHEKPKAENQDSEKLDVENLNVGNRTLQSTHVPNTHEQNTHKEEPSPPGEKKDALQAMWETAQAKKNKTPRTAGWSEATEGETKVSQRVADLWMGGKLPWTTDDIINACAAANRLIELHDGDVRNTIRTIDEYHRDHGGDFSVTSPWSLRNAITRYLAERKESEVIELRV